MASLKGKDKDKPHTTKPLLDSLKEGESGLYVDIMYVSKRRFLVAVEETTRNVTVQSLVDGSNDEVVRLLVELKEYYNTFGINIAAVDFDKGGPTPASLRSVGLSSRRFSTHVAVVERSIQQIKEYIYIVI